MTKARDLSKLLSTANGKIAGANLDVSFENITDTGTEGTRVATGTSAQRGSTTGQLRFNTTTGLAEYYTGTAFKSIDAPPTISSIDVTEVDSQAGGNQTIVITGSGFSSGATVTFLGNSGTDFNASTVTVDSNTQITAVAPKASFLNAQEPYGVKVTNVSGLSATLASQINVDSSPTWNTASGTLATILDSATGTHATVSATDPDGDTVSYSETGGTVLSTNNFSLDSSTGAISGDPVDVTASTTHTFTLRATANSKTADRSFNIIVNAYLDGSTALKANTSAKAIKTLTGTATSGLYWLKPTGFSYPAQFYCEMNYYGGGWTYIYQQQVSGGNGLSWTNSYQGSQNDASSAFRGVQDNNSTTHTPQEIWNGIVGSSNSGAIYCKETQTSGGSYVERQAYTNSSDSGIFTYSQFLNLFPGNFTNGQTGIKVHYNNGSSTDTSKAVSSWGNLVTINNGIVDDNLFYCNGNGVDGNWTFGLMQGGTPYPGSANATNGGSRGGTTRWATFAIREN
jgi:hypothetical protein